MKNIPVIKNWASTYSLFLSRHKVTGGVWVLRKHRGKNQFRMEITETDAETIVTEHGLHKYDDSVFRNITWYLHPEKNTKEIACCGNHPLGNK